MQYYHFHKYILKIFTNTVAAIWFCHCFANENNGVQGVALNINSNFLL